MKEEEGDRDRAIDGEEREGRVVDHERLVEAAIDEQVRSIDKIGIIVVIDIRSAVRHIERGHIRPLVVEEGAK